jgi:hypothetical protein
MTENMAFFPLWILLFASFGFAIGWALGDEVRRRKNAEERVEDLRDQLKHSAVPVQLREIAASSMTLTSTSSLSQKACKN